MGTSLSNIFSVLLLFSGSTSTTSIGNGHTVRYIATNDIYDWQNASNTCQLFGEERYNKSTLDIDYKMNMQEKRLLWISGHVNYSSWVTNYGCYRMEEKDKGTDLGSNISVSRCLEICNTDCFGLTNHRCNCFPAFDPTQPCNALCEVVPCVGNPLDQCSGDNTSIVMYCKNLDEKGCKLDKESVIQRDTNNSIRIFKNDTDKRQSYVCRVESEKEGSKYLYFEEEIPFNLTYDRCSHLTQNKTSTLSLPPGVTAWVGKVWSIENILLGSDFVDANRTVCIAAEISDKKEIQQLKTEKCSERLPALCVDRQNRDTPSTKGEAMGYNVTTLTNTSTLDDAILTPKSLTSSNQIINTEAVEFQTWYIVAAVIGIVLIILLSIPAIICFRNRNKRINHTKINHKTSCKQSGSQLDIPYAEVKDRTNSNSKCVEIYSEAMPMKEQAESPAVYHIPISEKHEVSTTLKINISSQLNKSAVLYSVVSPEYNVPSKEDIDVGTEYNELKLKRDSTSSITATYDHVKNDNPELYDCCTRENGKQTKKTPADVTYYDSVENVKK